MGFNRRRLEDQRRDAAEKEATIRRATDTQVLEDAERLIAAWNERQAIGAPMIFSPTIGAATRTGYWFLWVRCPACRTINALDLRTLDRHPDAAVTSLIPALSCRSCRRTRRSPSSCAYRGRASPTKCVRSIVGEYLANDRDRPGRRGGEFTFTDETLTLAVHANFHIAKSLILMEATPGIEPG
jgi:hypothetical protein